MSGTLNPLIYQLSNKPTVALQSPLDMLGQAGQTVNVLNQNRLFQAQQAAGQAFQQSIDPTTGLPSQNRLGINLSQLDPQNAIAVPGALEQGQTLAGQQQNVAQARNQVIGSMLGSVLNAPDDQLHNVAAATLDRGVTMGLIPQQQATALAMKLPDDPVALRTTLNQMQKSLLSPDQQRAAVYGAPTTVDNGLNVLSGTTTPVDQQGAGGFNPASQTPVYPSRAQQATPFSIQNPDGSPAITTTGAAVTAAGGGGLLGPPNGTPGRLPPALLPPGYNGGYPGRQPAPAPQAGIQPGPQLPAPPAPQQQSGAMPSVTTGPAPGVVEAARSTAQSNVEQAQTLQSSSDQSPNRQAMLGNMLTDLQSFTPGPGNSLQTRAQSLAQRLAPGISQAFGLDPQKVASAESFDKLATNLAQQQAGALGSGTNLQLETASHGNPNSTLSKLGATQIIQMLQGNEDAIQAKNTAWQAFKQANGAASYGDFSTQFNKTFDPRAFQAMRMAPVDRQRLIASIPGDPYKDPGSEAFKFRQKFNSMVAAGLIPNPQQAAPVVAPQAAAPAAPSGPAPDVPTGY